MASFYDLIPSFNRFILAVILLVMAKVVVIFHVQINANLYLDIDRFLALVFFLYCYFQMKHSRFQGRQILWLIFYVVTSLVLAKLLDLSLVKILVLFFLTALVEEILLRGVLFEWLLLKFSPLITVLSTSLLFTIAHPAIYQNPLYGLAVLFTGLILGGVYLFFRTTSKEMAIIHATGLHTLIILAGLKLALI